MTETMKPTAIENEFTATEDKYRAIGISTAHLTRSDIVQLGVLQADDDYNMIMGRDTGWFVKLYSEPEQNLGYAGMSDQFHQILVSAVKAGYQMVEFDSAATIYESLTQYE